MGRYARTGAMSDTDSETDDSVQVDTSSSIVLNKSNEYTSACSKDEEETSEEEFDQVPEIMSKQKFQVKRGEHRWKTFKKR